MTDSSRENEPTQSEIQPQGLSPIMKPDHVNLTPKARAAQIFEFSCQASVTFGKTVAKLARQGKAAYDEAQRKRRAANAEAERVRKVEFFASTVSEIESNSAYLNPSALRAAREFEAAVGSDVDALAEFARDDRVKRLLENGRKRAEFAEVDEEMQVRTFEFEVIPEQLFQAIGESNVTPVLNAIVKKYSMSNSGNVVAGAVLAGRKNYGGAALAMTESVKTGAHNGMVKKTFTEHLRYMRYIRSGSNLSEAHRAYAILANRLAFFGIGDSAIVGRARFSIVYDNGNAAFSPPQPPTKFSSNMHGEFHNNFLGYLWTVQQAIAQIDLIRASKPLAEELFGLKNIAPVLQRFTDPMPTPEEMLTAVRRRAQ